MAESLPVVMHAQVAPEPTEPTPRTKDMKRKVTQELALESDAPSLFGFCKLYFGRIPFSLYSNTTLPLVVSEALFQLLGILMVMDSSQKLSSLLLGGNSSS
mmetsp:Transcript_5387/g.12171  ORF Transcript_5387/g.12171 Transcript_5387/m.12171 type:complete len:101 (-) Transcript_5387:1808-2110(-)